MPVSQRGWLGALGCYGLSCVGMTWAHSPEQVRLGAACEVHCSCNPPLRPPLPLPGSPPSPQSAVLLQTRWSLLTPQFPVPPSPVISTCECLGAGAQGFPVPVVPSGYTGPCRTISLRVITKMTCGMTISALPVEGPGAMRRALLSPAQVACSGSSVLTTRPCSQPLSGMEFCHLPSRINTSKATVSKFLTSDLATHCDPLYLWVFPPNLALVSGVDEG